MTCGSVPSCTDTVRMQMTISPRGAISHEEWTICSRVHANTQACKSCAKAANGASRTRYGRFMHQCVCKLACRQSLQKTQKVHRARETDDLCTNVYANLRAGKVCRRRKRCTTHAIRTICAPLRMQTCVPAKFAKDAKWAPRTRNGQFVHQCVGTLCVPAEQGKRPKTCTTHVKRTICATMHVHTLRARKSLRLKQKGAPRT